MNKAEIHYLNCDDECCERFACVARRDYQRQISCLQEENTELIRVMNARDLNAALPAVAKALDESYDDPYGAHSPESCDDPTCSHF